MKYTDENISKLDFYFNNLAKSNDFEHYYLNALNNKQQSTDKKKPDAFMRDAHNYCQWTFLDYRNLDSQFKQYGDRRWFYVTESESPEYVQIRKDLINKWIKNNAKDTVLVVVPNGIIEIPMQRLFGYKPKSFKPEWNNDGNVVYRFDTSNDKVYGNKDYVADEKTISWIKDSSQYIGNCNYAAYRKSDKELIVARYNQDNTLKCFHPAKSIKQVFDDLNIEKNLDICYKTFQRLINKNMVGYFVEVGGCKYWLKVKDPASNAIPETWGNEVVEVSEESVESISINNISEKDEESVSELLSTATILAPIVTAENDDAIFGRPARTIIKVKTEIFEEKNEQDWLDAIERMKNPEWYDENGNRLIRRIIRG